MMLKNMKMYPQCTHGIEYIENQECLGCRTNHLHGDNSKRKTGSDATR